MRTYEADEVDAMIARAVAAEREACAKVCEKQEDYEPLCDTPEDCAAAIRARSQAAAQEQ